MPKDRRVGSLAFERARLSPYPCSPGKGKQTKTKNQVGSVEDVKEWEEARCPICMEPPHNAVLLRCSSFEQGCRPYMCNTSYRHSNCLDKFCESAVSCPSTAIVRDIPVSMTTASPGGRVPFSLPRPAGNSPKPGLVCPLCRGEIYGWSVVEPARNYMNSKARSCSSESCDFTGTYRELRKHARAEHPLARPTEIDPVRQHEWTRLERERDYEDMLSTFQPVVGDESTEEANLFDPFVQDFDSWLTVNLAYLAFVLDFLGTRSGELVQNGRSRNTMRFRYDLETVRGPRRANDLPSERMPLGSRNYSQSERVHQVRRPSSSQGDRTARRRGLRWRTQRWSTFNNAR